MPALNPLNSHDVLRHRATMLVDGTRERCQRYIDAVELTVRMCERQVNSTLNMVELHQAAEKNNHPLLTAYEARELADRWQRRAWIQRKAYTRLAIRARERMRELNDFAVSTAQDITDKMRPLEGLHLTDQDPFKK